MRGCCTEEREAGENFTKMRRKKIFSIPSSTSCTLIRRSRFTLTPSDPPASSRAIFFFLAYLTSLSYPYIPPSSYPCPHLSRCSQLRCLWRTRPSRAFQIPLGTTGSAMAMPLPAETDTWIRRRRTGWWKQKGNYGTVGWRAGREGKNTAKKSDRGEILFFARKTRTCRRCLFRALSSIQNL